MCERRGEQRFPSKAARNHHDYYFVRLSSCDCPRRAAFWIYCLVCLGSGFLLDRSHDLIACGVVFARDSMNRHLETYETYETDGMSLS